MEQELRSVGRDPELKMEAYRFQGHTQPFPPHFHSCYVIGLMEDGRRDLLCRGERIQLTPGSLLLLAPGDSHSCTPDGPSGMDYRSLNLPPELLSSADGSPMSFRTPVIRDTVAERCLRQLHRLVMEESQDPSRVELLGLLVEALRPYCISLSAAGEEPVELVCRYLEQHYARHITLEELCRLSGLSKSSLLRAFTRSKGITPYRYLENVRVGHARQLLEQGVPPAEAALCAGFADQSHFTNYFTTFTGVTPGAYRALFPPDGGGAPELEKECLT